MSQQSLLELFKIVFGTPMTPTIQGNRSAARTARVACVAAHARHQATGLVVYSTRPNGFPAPPCISKQMRAYIRIGATHRHALPIFFHTRTARYCVCGPRLTILETMSAVAVSRQTPYGLACISPWCSRDPFLSSNQARRLLFQAASRSVTR